MSKIDWSEAPHGAEWFLDGIFYRQISGFEGEVAHWNGSTWHANSVINVHNLTGVGAAHRDADLQPLISIEDAQPEGRKLDCGKVIMGAIPPDAELAVARVLTFGAEKYARDNWRKVPDMDVQYMDAALRHLNAYRRGEKVDSESGESHLAHAACCIMFLLQIKEESK